MRRGQCTWLGGALPQKETEFKPHVCVQPCLALGSCCCADTRPFETFARRFQLMLCHKICQGRLQPPTPQPLARQGTSAARLGSCTLPLPAGELCDSLVPPASPAVLAPTGFRPLRRFIFPFCCSPARAGHHCRGSSWSARMCLTSSPRQPWHVPLATLHRTSSSTWPWCPGCPWAAGDPQSLGRCRAVSQVMGLPRDPLAPAGIPGGKNDPSCPSVETIVSGLQSTLTPVGGLRHR